ncbi:MAG: hypothetical protein GEU75_03815 [Dehalococcoidia bacterium]|nr:hypothetical protein [Dehalococcoidia bacterium]
MCLFFTLLLAGPRVAIVFWWLINPDRWDAAFDTFVLPALGFIFVPWTTLMFVIVAPFGNVAGWDWFWLVLALVADISTWGSSSYSNRGRIPGYA